MSDMPTDGAEVELPLEAGQSVTMPASGTSNMVTYDTPVEVAFQAVECADVLPGLGQDSATFEPKDFQATAGQQACLVSLEVNNLASEPNNFNAETFSTLLTSDGNQYSPSSQTFDTQAIAQIKGVPTSVTSDAVQPGGVGYDFVIYEIPVNTTPEALVFRVYTYQG